MDIQELKTIRLSVDALERNEKNFYSLDNIRALADMILAAGGVLSPLLVLEPDPVPGPYRIVDGERRWLASIMLRSEGHEGFDVVPCRILPPMTADQEQLQLIAANAQREKTTADELREAEQLYAILSAAKARGQEEEAGVDLRRGRLRDAVARIMDRSATKIAQIERINKYLIPELRQQLEDGDLKFSAAYELAGLPEEEQRETFEAAKDRGEEITHKEVVAAKAAKPEKKDENAWASPDCERVNGTCGHWPVIKANFMHKGALDRCAGCCQSCLDWKTCDYCCAIMAEKRPIEAEPKTADSLCYSCANWKRCLDRTDKTTACGKYEDKNAKKPEPEPPLHVQKVDQALEQSVERVDDVLDMIRACIECAGLPETQLRACLTLFDELVELYEGGDLNV